MLYVPELLWFSSSKKARFEKPPTEEKKKCLHQANFTLLIFLVEPYAAIIFKLKIPLKIPPGLPPNHDR